MSTATVGDFLHRLKRGMAAKLLDVESDGQLVERVLTTREEAALVAIVLRHGTMVYQVCRRVLRNPQDAEDAFQATFLVLVQQLHALRQHNSLAGWLHGVALRVSRKARARAMAQQRWEAGAALPEAAPPDDLTWSEVRLALDEELSRLPEKLRLPLVLCHLEGQTQDEAAKQLGWSKSTLRRRLEEARTALGSRLTRRGIAWFAVLPAALVSDSLPAAALSLACIDSTVAAALAVVNGKSLALAASANVAVLTEGVLTTMFVKKLVSVAGALVVLALATAIGGHFYHANAATTAVPPERGFQGQAEPEGPALPVVFLPAQAKEPEPLTLKGHTSEVRSVAFSPDGKRIVTGAGELPRGGLGGGGGGGGKPPGPGELKVWDAAKGTEILDLKGHTGTLVYSACFSPDGDRIASAGAFLDATVRVWDAEKGEEIFVLKNQTPSVGSVCFSPDGKRIATISATHIKVWDAENGKELLILKSELRPGGNVCFSPDGKRIAGVYPWNVQGKPAPTEIKVWDAVKGEELVTIKTPHASGTANICFSPDGKRIASAAGEQPIMVWDAANGKELLALKGHTAFVCSICFSPDGKRLASASWDMTAKVWDAEKGQELVTLKGHTAFLRSVCFSPDGNRVATASRDQTVKVWSLEKAK